MLLWCGVPSGQPGSRAYLLYVFVAREPVLLLVIVSWYVLRCVLTGACCLRSIQKLRRLS